MAGIVDFLKDEYAQAAKSFGILKNLSRTAKNNPANAATMDAVFGLGGIVPGAGDVVSAAEAKYRYDQGDKFGAALAGLGALPLIPNMAGIFIGKGAKTWDALQAAKAKKLAAAGVDPKTIWQQTGTWKGPDGKWRQEIDDRAATAQFTHLPERGQDRIAEQAFTHPALSRAYPDLAGFSQLGLRGGQPSGRFERIGDSGIIRAIAPDEKSLKSVLSHEFQHPIQDIEGFAPGGSPEQIAGEIAESRQRFAEVKRMLEKSYDRATDTARHVNQRIINEATEYAAQRGPYFEAAPQSDKVRDYILSKDAGYNRLYKEIHDLSKKVGQDPYETYRKLAGEAEARAVQARLDMTPAQRRATFPEDSYDVPMDELIVREPMSGLQESAAMPEGWISGWRTRVEQPYITGPQPPKMPKDTWGGYDSPEEYLEARQAQQLADQDYNERMRAIYDRILSEPLQSPLDKPYRYGNP